VGYNEGILDGFVVALYIGTPDGSGISKRDCIIFTVPIFPLLFGAPIAIWVPFDEIATYLPAASSGRSPSISLPR